MRAAPGLLAAALALAFLPHAAGADSASSVWRALATPADRQRLRAWHDAWDQALAKARAHPGDAATLAADPTLFDPDRALGGAFPPDGRYRCRVVKLGAHGAAMRDLTAYPAGECRIASHGATTTFTRLGMGQRPAGQLYADTGARAIFLGSAMLGDETRALDYGRDGGRDMIGYVERVDARRWRMVLPFPRFESLLDVVELVPAAD